MVFNDPKTPRNDLKQQIMTNEAILETYKMKKLSNFLSLTGLLKNEFLWLFLVCVGKDANYKPNLTYFF